MNVNYLKKVPCFNVKFQRKFYQKKITKEQKQKFKPRFHKVLTPNMLKSNSLPNVGEGLGSLECSHVADKGLRRILYILVKQLGKMFVIHVFNMCVISDQANLLLGRYQGEI